MARLYLLIAATLAFARQYYLPNPFECLGDKAALINLIAEPFIHALAFLLVGLIYRRGEAPILGSILYFITYAILVGILCLMGIFSFAWWWVLLIISIPIIITVVLCMAKARYDRC